MPSTKWRELVMAKKKQIGIYSEPAGATLPLSSATVGTKTVTVTKL